MSECCKVCHALQLAIDKCDTAIKKIETGDVETPPLLNDSTEDLFHGIMEQRYEYLENYRSHLNFLLNNDQRDKMSV